MVGWWDYGTTVLYNGGMMGWWDDGMVGWYDNGMVGGRMEGW